MVELSISSIFQNELLPGEKIIWTGQPEQSQLFTKADIFLVPFTFIWFGGVLSIGKDMFSAKSNIFQAPLPFSLVPFFFLIIGFYMAIGRFVYNFLRKKKTYYAVTNKRVLVLIDFFGRNLQAAYINNLPSINKSINTKGIGSIIFGSQNTNTTYYNNTGLDFFGSSSNASIPAFFDIKDANDVYNKVTKLRNSEA